MIIVPALTSSHIYDVCHQQDDFMWIAVIAVIVLIFMFLAAYLIDNNLLCKLFGHSMLVTKFKSRNEYFYMKHDYCERCGRIVANGAGCLCALSTSESAQPYPSATSRSSV